MPRVEDGGGAARAGNEPGDAVGRGIGKHRARWRVPATSELGQHAGQDLQSQILLVAQPVGPALDDADLVVESFDEAQGDLVLGATVGGNPVPVPLEQLGELLVRLEALPLQRRSPILEEAARPALAAGIQSWPNASLSRQAVFKRLFAG